MWSKWQKVNHMMTVKDTDEEIGQLMNTKRGLPSWEVKNKIKTRYHLLPSGLAVRRAADNIRCCWGCREWHSQRLVGEEMSTAVLKGKLALFIKTESFTSYDPEIAMFPRKTLSCVGPERRPECWGLLLALGGLRCSEVREEEPEWKGSFYSVWKSQDHTAKGKKPASCGVI